MARRLSILHVNHRKGYINRSYRTDSLDQAALLATFGAQVTHIGGAYPNNTFVLRVNPFLLWYIRLISWVPFEKYVTVRQSIKRRIKVEAGLNPKITGENKGFKFVDLARVGRFTKSELAAMEKNR